MGNAYYRQEKYSEACETYEGAAAAEDIGIAAGARYNLGNSRYR